MKGNLYINGLDAFETWGIDLEDGAVTNLMTPPALKELVRNSSRLEHGRRYVVPTSGYATPKYDERQVDLPIHLISTSSTDFFAKYQAFCDDVLIKGAFTLWVRHIPHKLFHLVYNSCSNFNQTWRVVSVMTLRCTEPNPEDTAPHTWEIVPQGYISL